MDGPQLLTTPDDDWDDRLAHENVRAWYHQPKLYALLRRLNLERIAKFAAPRGFSRSDADGVPDADDRTEVMASILEGAIGYLRALDEGRKPTQHETDCAYVIAHEFFHCKVPWQGTVPAAEFAEKDELYGHPNAMVPALQHVVRRRAAINSFSGIFRWRKVPAAAFDLEFLPWLRARVAERGIVL